MDELYRFGPGLAALADGETTLCRCEEVTHEEALQAVREGATDMNEVKAWTRVGMGRCQGRMCGPALCQLIARATGRPADEAGVFSSRPPARPVPLGALTRQPDTHRFPLRGRR
jgi:NAD(P)H-nitrite reductase large subunit